MALGIGSTVMPAAAATAPVPIGTVAQINGGAVTLYNGSPRPNNFGFPGVASTFGAYQATTLVEITVFGIDPAFAAGDHVLVCNPAALDPQQRPINDNTWIVIDGFTIGPDAWLIVKANVRSRANQPELYAVPVAMARKTV